MEQVVSTRQYDRPVADSRLPTRARASHDLVLRGIGRAIVAGEFPVGKTLPGKHDLMLRFGVSNTPLREALQTLAAKGLVTAKTKIGTWVLDEAHWNMFDADILAWRLEAGLDTKFLKKLFEIRHALEPMAAALAAAHRTDEQAARLRGLADELYESANDKRRFSEVDLDFHLCVLDASHNPFMRSVGAIINTAFVASFSLSAPPSPDMAAASCDQHRAIADAIADRDVQGAADAMTNVIRVGSTNSGLAPQPLACVHTEHFA